MHDPVAALKEYIRFPSVSVDPAYREGMAGARDYVRDLLTEAGMEVEIVSTPLHPIILGRRHGDPSWPHVIIYGHYDVQPPDPLDLWTSPPFEPEVRGERLYGRGAADNKGPLLVHLAAVTQLLKEQPDLPLRITFLIEGEEEMGSPSFLPFLESHKGKIDADFVLLSDTGSPREDQIAITTGLRGIVTFEVEVIGPKSDLHSGVHGGALLNPIQALSEICASLHDNDGRVNVPGFYDAVLDVQQWERDELAKLGTSEADYADFLGITDFHPPKGFTPFEAVRFQPTLEFNGIGGGYQGEGSKTVIPSRAFAKISCRLVPDQDPETIKNLVFKAIEERAPKGVKVKVTSSHGGVPYLVAPPGRPNTPADQNRALSSAFEAADSAIAETFGNRPLYLREGGSVPIIADIKRVWGLDSLMIGLFLPEDNLHAPDESFHLGVMKNAIEVVTKLLRSVAQSGRGE
ncbi:MAG TPA: M20/M25/M40 family metallo-hydrolase [Opitutales bacterium]|nr:M20/M25/M40 family metallo-hydrolase [Opitutales bacterium]